MRWYNIGGYLMFIGMGMEWDGNGKLILIVR
jgi:hypothetical protein